MERLSYWNEEYGCWSYRGPSGEAAKRLAAYENTDREPEEIKDLLSEKSIFNLVGKVFSLAPDRVRELVHSEKDGRLVVLPCKEGDTVYEVEPLWIATICDKDSKCRSCNDFYEGGMGDTPCCLREEDECLTISEKTATLSMIADWMDHAAFGKTVFQTRQEAAETLVKETAE